MVASPVNSDAAKAAAGQQATGMSTQRHPRDVSRSGPIRRSSGGSKDFHAGLLRIAAQQTSMPGKTSAIVYPVRKNVAALDIEPIAASGSAVRRRLAASHLVSLANDRFLELSVRVWPDGRRKLVDAVQLEDIRVSRPL